MSEWRSIETAPKDGTRVLVSAVGRDYVLIAAHAQGRFRGNPWRENFETGRCTLWNPTHWMPLPKPPFGAGG